MHLCNPASPWLEGTSPAPSTAGGVGHSPAALAQDSLCRRLWADWGEALHKPAPSSHTHTPRLGCAQLPSCLQHPAKSCFFNYFFFFFSKCSLPWLEQKTGAQCTGEGGAGDPSPNREGKACKASTLPGILSGNYGRKLEGDGHQGGQNPSFGGEDHSSPQRMLCEVWQRQHRHPGALVPVRVNHPCPKALVLEQPHAEILVSKSWFPKPGFHPGCPKLLLLPQGLQGLVPSRIKCSPIHNPAARSAHVCRAEGGLRRGSGSGSPLSAPPEEMTQGFSTKPQADRLAACLAAPAHGDHSPGDVGGTPRDGGC